MTEDLSNRPDREQRLNEVLLEYVEEAQAGRVPDRRRLLAAHADLRPELEEFFASHDEVERLAAPLREAERQAAPPREGARADPEGDIPAHGPGGGRGPEAGAGPAPAGPGVATPEVGQLGDFRLLREVGRGGM